MIFNVDEKVNFADRNEFRAWLIREIEKFERAAVEGPFYPDKFVTPESYLRMAEIVREELYRDNRTCLHLAPE